MFLSVAGEATVRAVEARTYCTVLTVASTICTEVQHFVVILWPFEMAILHCTCLPSILLPWLDTGYLLQGTVCCMWIVLVGGYSEFCRLSKYVPSNASRYGILVRAWCCSKLLNCSTVPPMLQLKKRVIWFCSTVLYKYLKLVSAAYHLAHHT